MGPQVPTSIVPASTYGELHTGSSQVPICLRNLSAYPIVIPTKVVIGKVAPAIQVPPVVLPMENLPMAPRKTETGEIEPTGSRRVAQGGTRTFQEAAGQMEPPVCPQQPGPGKDIPN